MLPRLRVLSISLVLLACSSSSSSSPSATAPDPSACVAAVAEHQRTVAAHLDAARAKTGARDGAGCLVELDAYDKDAWSPTPSTNPTSAMAMSRAMCMMLAGDCTHGKELYRGAMQSSAGATMSPEMLGKSVDAMAAMYCEGSSLEPRDELLKALMDLNRGAYMTTSTSAACQGEVDTVQRLIPQVKPRDAYDSQVVQAPAILRVAGPECLARAGDCDGAWHVFHDAWFAEHGYDDAKLRTMFGSVVKKCAGK